MDVTHKIDRLIVEKSVKELKAEIEKLKKIRLTALGKKKLKELEDELFVKSLGS